ncbi:hypothetical protein B0T21DRAFT_416140 [Apiosordaria backusii]|uniref:Uncharacterized protein n=1 Tax=Apiosordaria backusii TaxID=314023 RepID=A0AA40A3X2_9PEZI|nr:hypothetical protein B0T21DRAFT_416140 [Apiosordaria backusii]
MRTFTTLLLVAVTATATAALTAPSPAVSIKRDGCQYDCDCASGQSAKCCEASGGNLGGNGLVDVWLFDGVVEEWNW